MNDQVFQIKRRHLPHIFVDGAVYFLTFCVLETNLSEQEQEIVLEHIKTGVKYYVLLSVVVMPDHVHAVLIPKTGVFLSRVVKGIKGVSSRKINLQRGEHTEKFKWQDETYDRVLRNKAELEQKIKYIYDNPAKKGFSKEGATYKFWYFNNNYEEELKGMKVLL